MNKEKINKKGENFLKNRSDIKAIEKEIMSGVSLTQLGSKYNCSASSLSRYKNKYLVAKCNAAQANRNLKEGESLLELLEEHIRNVTKLSNACLEQLQDPEDPNKLFLGARAEDITVSYMEEGRTDEGKITYKKAKEKLSVLISRLNEQLEGFDHEVGIEINSTDRAHTLIAASNAMNKHINLFAELTGKLGNTTINITNQPVFLELTQQVIQILEEYPGAREKLAERMRSLNIEEKESV